LRILLLTVILLSITTAGFGLYIMKKGSADGRMLIWQVTGQLIKQSPVTGHGTGAFNALYMNEQANWFESGTATEAQAMVAGSPEAPFNEPLKLWLEKGFIGILLAVGILYFLFVTNNKTLNPKPKTINPNPSWRDFATLQLLTSFKGALISLLVFGLFSYPFDISSFVLQSIILVAILAGTSHQIINIAGRKALLLTFPVAFTIILGSVYYSPLRQRHFKAMRIWQEANQRYSYRAYQSSVVAYEEVFPELQSNGLFLQMYGKALNMDEEFQKSNDILALAQKQYSSYVIENTIGDNHKVLGNYDEAEVAYKKSIYMVPSLMLPKYLLAKFYNESGQHQKAKQTAEEILNTPVKVESSATREIMSEMKKIVTQSKK
ncbi:MAG TPA: O-antigen ligase family protein, partial [Flavobacteriaceae bacterium]|nr:O-antigen ligase family protein [Flavobacteriaceae bacterium]